MNIKSGFILTKNCNLCKKKGTLKIEFANFMILVLNQSPINTIFPLTRFSGSPKFVLSGDPLYNRGKLKTTEIETAEIEKWLYVTQNNNPLWFKLNYCASTRAYGLANFPSAVQEAGQSTNTVKYILEDLLLLFDHELSLLWSKKNFDWDQIQKKITSLPRFVEIVLFFNVPFSFCFLLNFWINLIEDRKSDCWFF